MHIECNSNNILVTLKSEGSFNGMIYPKGLSTNSTCMVEYKHVDSVTYLLPLRACNTMSADVVSKSVALSLVVAFMSDDRQLLFTPFHADTHDLNRL